MKRTIILFLSLLIIFIPIGTYAASEVVVMDLDSGRILYEKNANEKRLIASITKIMTAIVTIENAKLDNEILVGDEVLKSYGTNTYIEVGEKITVKDLLYGLILRSGNDAALTLASNVSSSEEEFVKLMNNKAKEIGMTSTTFENPHGLDDDTKNYSTAHDMAILSRYTSQNKIYKSIAKTKKYSVKTNKKSYIWYNRNKLLNNYDKCIGGKNGYTPSAGKTLVSMASNDNLNLTIVTLNDPNIYDTHQELYEEYFQKYKNYKIIDKDKFTFDKSLVSKQLYIKDSFYYPLKAEEVKSVETKIKIDSKQNDKVGKIYIYLNQQEIGSIDVFEKEKEEKTLLEKIRNLIF